MLTRCIIEMMGAPKEHLVETLRGYVEKWKQDKIRIRKEHFAEPEQEGKLWRTFAELEIEFDTPAELMGFCLDALPASVEIIEPEQVQTSSQGLTATLNDMLSRLHEADMLVKQLRSQMSLLDKNATQTFRNFIRYACKEPKTVAELAPLLGVDEQELKSFLDKMVEENLLNLSGQRYAVHG